MFIYDERHKCVLENIPKQHARIYSTPVTSDIPNGPPDTFQVPLNWERGRRLCAGGGSRKFSQKHPFKEASNLEGKKTSPDTSQLLWTKHMGLLKFINIQWCLYLNTYLFRNLQLPHI